MYTHDFSWDYYMDLYAGNHHCNGWSYMFAYEMTCHRALGEDYD